MVIPLNIRKCVAFLGVRLADGTYTFAGSAFWVTDDAPESPDSSAVPIRPLYLVTARHVIDAVAALGATEIHLRVNLKDGNSEWIKSRIDDWYMHPINRSLDVAIIETGIPSDWDHLVLPFSLGITDELIEKHQIDVGDEVFITGLFRHHHGSRRNIPIVRVGNLASLTDEPIETKSFGLMRGLLIECRSIGGLSGSPVFVNLGAVRLLDGQLKSPSSGAPIFFLVGSIHGHYDVDIGRTDQESADSSNLLGGGRVNTGIAIVTPFRSVREVIRSFESTR